MNARKAARKDEESERERPNSNNKGAKMFKLPEPTSKFVKIRCPKCKNEQITFGKASTQVKCHMCEKTLADPSGGKARIKARILEILE